MNPLDVSRIDVLSLSEWRGKSTGCTGLTSDNSPCQSGGVNPLDVVRACVDMPCQGEGVNGLDVEIKYVDRSCQSQG